MDDYIWMSIWGFDVWITLQLEEQIGMEIDSYMLSDA